MKYISIILIIFLCITVSLIGCSKKVEEKQKVTNTQKASTKPLKITTNKKISLANKTIHDKFSAEDTEKQIDAFKSFFDLQRKLHEKKPFTLSQEDITILTNVPADVSALFLRKYMFSSSARNFSHENYHAITSIVEHIINSDAPIRIKGDVYYWAVNASYRIESMDELVEWGDKWINMCYEYEGEKCEVILYSAIYKSAMDASALQKENIENGRSSDNSAAIGWLRNYIDNEKNIPIKKEREIKGILAFALVADESPEATSFIKNYIDKCYENDPEKGKEEFDLLMELNDELNKKRRK